MIEGLGQILNLLTFQMRIKPLSQLVTLRVLRLQIGAKSLVVTESTNNSSSVIQELEILLRLEPGEKIDDSGDESGDQENEESDNFVQPSLPSQLS